MSSDAERLGRALMAARAERGLKRKDLAEAAGLSYPYVAEIENGGKQPSARALQSLAGALGMTPGDLLRRSEDLPGETDARGGPGSASRPPAMAYELLSPSSAAPPPTSFSSSADEELVGRISAAVAAAVNMQLRDWLRSEIPRLVRDEVQRARGMQR